MIIETAIARWKEHLRGNLPGGWDELLHPDCVFYSPIVYTPQRGRDLTKMYLTAAGQTLPGDSAPEPGAILTDAPSAGAFRYTKQVLQDDTAVLEFETTVEGLYVNGVDIIRCDADGRIIEFRVMIRPLQAVNIVHAQMMATLEAMRS